jgi:hypothetical protein
MRFALSTLAFCALFASAANAVVIGTQDWRQLTETTGLSWNQVSTVCSTTTGACAGSLGTVSFDGWTWAENADVAALFDQLIQPSTTQFPTPTSAYVAANDPGIAAAIGTTGFLPTFAFTNFEEVHGLSRTEFTLGGPNARDPYLLDLFDPSHPDAAVLSGFVDKTIAAAGLGFWLYRPVEVTEPGTLLLLTAGLLAVAATRRRRAAK